MEGAGVCIVCVYAYTCKCLSCVPHTSQSGDLTSPRHRARRHVQPRAPTRARVCRPPRALSALLHAPRLLCGPRDAPSWHALPRPVRRAPATGGNAEYGSPQPVCVKASQWPTVSPHRPPLCPPPSRPRGSCTSPQRNHVSSPCTHVLHRKPRQESWREFASSCLKTK